MEEQLQKRIADLTEEIEALETEIAKSITTQELAIVNDKGKKRARIAVDDDDTVSINLADKNERTAASISVTADGEPSITMRNSRGETCIELTITDPNHPVILLKSPENDSEIRIETSTARAGLHITRNGKEIELALEPDNPPHLLLSDDRGNQHRIETER